MDHAQQHAAAGCSVTTLCTTLCSDLNVCSGAVSQGDKSAGGIKCQQQKSAFGVILGCPVHVAHDLEVYSRFVSGWGEAGC